MGIAYRPIRFLQLLLPEEITKSRGHGGISHFLDQAEAVPSILLS